MKRYFQQSVSAAPLAVFRIAWGLLLAGSVLRFWAKGWIQELYIDPKFFFPFYGFEFVVPLGHYTYLLFAICGISAFLVAIGLHYRWASIALFLSFTYIELIDKSTYLNHYYFVSVVCLLMVFLPAHVYFSVDAYRNRKLLSDTIPAFCIDALKLFACMVYIFAGLAKVNSEWLLQAQPLRTWLPARNDVAFIGGLFNYVWVAYLFSWIGCLYDLCIPFLLLKKPTRLFAYFVVIAFHLLTAILFPIGMFPYIMIATALIFFSAEFHLRILHKLNGWLRMKTEFLSTQNNYEYPSLVKKGVIAVFIIFFFVQTVLPFRYLFYPGELFWTEQGYRFSWRVMLMEKAGLAEFTVKDASGKKVVVDNSIFLTTLQQKMMATQPDMILQYAHMLRDHYAAQGFISPQVFVDSYVTLNGRLGKPLVDPSADLAKEEDSFAPKPWIMPVSK